MMKLTKTELVRIIEDCHEMHAQALARAQVAESAVVFLLRHNDDLHRQIATLETVQEESQDTPEIAELVKRLRAKGIKVHDVPGWTEGTSWSEGTVTSAGVFNPPRPQAHFTVHEDGRVESNVPISPPANGSLRRWFGW